MGLITFIFTFSCREATELFEKRTVFKLAPVENFMIHFHKVVCKHCRKYEKQNAYMDQLFQQHFVKIKDNSFQNLSLSPGFKEQLISNLNRNQ